MFEPLEVPFCILFVKTSDKTAKRYLVNDQNLIQLRVIYLRGQMFSCTRLKTECKIFLMICRGKLSSHDL